MKTLVLELQDATGKCDLVVLGGLRQAGKTFATQQFVASTQNALLLRCEHLVGVDSLRGFVERWLGEFAQEPPKEHTTSTNWIEQCLSAVRTAAHSGPIVVALDDVDQTLCALKDSAGQEVLICHLVANLLALPLQDGISVSLLVSGTALVETVVALEGGNLKMPLPASMKRVGMAGRVDLKEFLREHDMDDFPGCQFEGKELGFDDFAGCPGYLTLLHRHHFNVKEVVLAITARLPLEYARLKRVRPDLDLELLRREVAQFLNTDNRPVGQQFAVLRNQQHWLEMLAACNCLKNLNQPAQPPWSSPSSLSLSHTCLASNRVSP
jgi:hypothetical protein